MKPNKINIETKEKFKTIKISFNINSDIIYYAIVELLMMEKKITKSNVLNWIKYSFYYNGLEYFTMNLPSYIDDNDDFKEIKKKAKIILKEKFSIFF